MSAIAAVDTALWDIKGKVARLPIYELLGGASRDGVMVYGHANGRDIAETLDEVGRYIDMGYKAIRAQSGIPGLASTYGVSKDRMYYEPADAAIATENVWSTAKYLDHAPKLFEAIRARFGFEHHLLHDVHHRLTPIEAGRLGKSLEPYRLFWMEDPTPAENQEGFRLIRQHTVTPIAVGEIFNTIYDCQTLITEQLIDYIRTTVVHAGGITHLRRIAHLAELYHVRTGRTVRPICRRVHGRALNFDLWVHNFGSRNTCAHARPTRCSPCLPFKDGYLHPATRRATASTSTRSSPRNIRTRPSALPVNRLEGGRVRRSGYAALKCPDFPPDFSSRRTSSMRMPRSTDLHMS